MAKVRVEVMLSGAGGGVVVFVGTAELSGATSDEHLADPKLTSDGALEQCVKVAVLKILPAISVQRAAEARRVLKKPPTLLPPTVKDVTP